MARISLEDSHFYLSHWASWDALKTLHEWHLRRGPAADAPYPNRHAWESILHVYFPSHYDQSQLEIQPDGTAQGIKYLLLKKFFDAAAPSSPPDDFGTGEGITLERITVDLPARVNHIRDILWVKCNPPSTDGTTTQWASAMRTTVAYLGQRHPARATYFILAVGMHWLPFYWDPENPRPEGRGLRVEAEGKEGWCAVSPQVHAPPGINAGHIDGEGVVVHLDRARTLDCFTGAGPSFADERPRLTYQEDLDFLEEFLGVVARHAYVGEHEMSLG